MNQLKHKQIVFTGVNTAEYLDLGMIDLDSIGPKDVVVRTSYSTVSCGTERANLAGNLNVNPSGNSPAFPRSLGYSSCGTVLQIGKDVTRVKVGDQVVVFWGKHTNYNVIPENQVELIPEGVHLQDAAISFIATFPLAAIRKVHLEIGESCLVMGLGLLGQLAVKLAKLGGAYPVIAADPNSARRELSLQNGADYALDPMAPDFIETVKTLTEGGAKVAIEVTGVGAGLNEVLDVMARFGRVALLGCTRDSNFTVDYYKKIHAPGITLVGAHTAARPEVESHPGYWTHNDDLHAVLQLLKGNRLFLQDLIKEVHQPSDCPDVYHRLVFDSNCPVGMQFNWENE